jgi:hypothetical protein
MAKRGVMADDQRLRLVIAALRRIREGRRRVSVHHHLAAEHAHAAALGLREIGVDRDGMDRAEGERRRRPIAGKLVEEEYRLLGRVGWIGEALLLDKSIFLEPFEQLRPIGSDDLCLREMDVRIDESRQDERIGVVIDWRAGRQGREQRGRLADRCDAAVPHHHEAVDEIAIARLVPRPLRRRKKGEHAAAHGAEGRISHGWKLHCRRRPD